MPDEITIQGKIGKLGIIAGGGHLPLLVAKQAKNLRIPIHTILLSGISDEGNFPEIKSSFAIGSINKIFKSLHEAQCKSVCFAGQINRPDFNKLKLDSYGIRMLPSILLAASKGDDFLLRAIIKMFEKEGFQVIGPQEIANNIVATAGLQNNIIPSKQDLVDLNIAKKVAKITGELDIGQGVVVCRGLVLAVEAQEGTDEMLRRCVSLPKNIRGQHTKRAGVLVKRMKPGQEERVDMPTMGVKTVQLAIDAGLSGIGYIAGETFLIDIQTMSTLAEENGLFLLGMDNQDNHNAELL